jgi:hypothetical protein
LAWILIQKAELEQASELLQKARKGPAGTTSDFAVVARASLLTQQGRAVQAMKLLRPLHGRIINGVERYLTTEQLVQTAMAAGYYSEALFYAVDWAHQAGERDRDRVHERVKSLLRRIPRAYLEQALTTLEPRIEDSSQDETPLRRAQHEAPLRHAQQQWLYHAITERLAAIALEIENADLAQRVLTHNPGLATGANAEDLVRLATGGDATFNIAGRTVGLLISTADAQTQRRSTEVAIGVTSALQADASSAAPRLELVFGEDAGDNTESALTALAGSGAALIIAGMQPNSASAAARFAGRVKVPLITLEESVVNNEFTFTLSASAASQESELSKGIAALGGKLTSSIAVTSRVAATSSIVVTEADCTHHAGAEARFPIQAWKAADVHSLLLLTSAECARAVAAEAKLAAFRPVFALGLEATQAASALRGETVVSLRAGHFPGSRASASLLRFIEQHQRAPTWFETLGHDAGVLARAVLTSLPEVTSTDEEQASRFHAQVQTALSSIKVRDLWSSEQGVFDAARSLKRELAYERSP